ncbi:hypothetical protein NPIL_306561 [Nephila pilipes]|uniref:Uncharacterized protein n=1 Tax=Nephila pilipes TaxID=299642 RepID=A0A8X6U518_NEPPI|nr:hypothetical protein NPIL_306561 [Nephila pilipes]
MNHSKFKLEVTRTIREPTLINRPTDYSQVLTPSRRSHNKFVSRFCSNSFLPSVDPAANEWRNRDVARGPEVPRGPRCGKKTNKFNKIGGPSPSTSSFLLSSGSLLFRS